MRLPALAALGVFTGLTACAPMSDTAGGAAVDSASARQCLNISQVTNFRQGRHNQLFLRIGRSEVFELVSAGGCTDFDFANQLAIMPDSGGATGARLCVGDTARVYAHGSSETPMACRARITRKLTDEEIAALPDSHRP